MLRKFSICLLRETKYSSVAIGVLTHYLAIRVRLLLKAKAIQHIDFNLPPLPPPIVQIPDATDILLKRMLPFNHPYHL